MAHTYSVHPLRAAVSVGMILTLLAAPSCANQSAAPEENAAPSTLVTSNERGEAIKTTPGFSKAAENAYLELYVNGQTAEIYVKDKGTGTMWYSNPPDREADNLASGSAKTEMNSQIRIEYIDEFDRVLYMNSYEDCIQYERQEFAVLDNGLRVTYTIGEKNSIFLVPIIIRQDRFEELLSKMSKEDQDYVSTRYDFVTLKDLNEEAQALLLETYPSLENHDIYALTNLTMPDFVMQKLEERFTSVGYTLEDLSRDNSENFLEPVSAPIEFTVALEYILDGSDLVVKIPHDALRSSADVNMTKIYLLDYFGAAGVQEEGYIFVPDGSGALIDFNNGKQNYEPYQKNVYGTDYTIPVETKATVEQPCHLPVFGLKKDQAAFLAVIEKGDSSASIRADVSGRSNQYNSVSALFEVLKSNIQSLPYGDYPDIHMFAQRPISEDMQIRYMFLYGENTDYTDMALTYQKYLADRDMIYKSEYKEELPFSLEMIGTIDYKASMLLMPVKKHKKLTGYSEAQELLQKLNKDGVSNIHFVYDSWANGGFDNRVNNTVKLIGALGDQKSFRDLSAYASQKNIGLYPDVDFMYVGEKTLGFDANKNAAKTISDVTAFRYAYNLGTNAMDTDTGRYIVKPASLLGHVKGFLEKYQTYENPFISVSTFGTDLNSDFSAKNGSNREEAKNRVIESLEHLKGSGYAISSSGANAYTLKYLSFVTDVPEDSSRYYILDHSVPFYQIVIHGYIPYSGGKINLAGNQKAAFLKALELGASPSYLWTYAPNHELKGTDYDYFSTYYENWYGSAMSLYRTLNEVLADVQGAAIVQHQEVAHNAYKTTYANGTSVIVNYNDASVQVDGCEVGAEDYLVIKEETN